MSDVVIRVENLGKCYEIKHAGGERERYTALRDVIAEKARGLFSRSQKSGIGGQRSEIRPPSSALRHHRRTDD